MKQRINNKGFSMVEVLAVVVILGVISSIGIVAVSKLVESSRNNYYLTQQKQMVLATQAYVNDNRNLLPKQIGSITSIRLQDLVNKKYLTDEIVDQNKTPCDSEKSHVDIYKASTTDYKYVGYLECDACKKISSDGSKKCYDKKDIKEPSITISIPNVSSNQSANINSTISIEIQGASDDDNIKVSSYSYKIYVDGVLKKSTGLLINNKDNKITINKERIFNYVPGKIKVVVTATNTEGITKSKSSANDLSDVLSPACGRVTYENNNKLKDYDYVNPNDIKCGSADYPWINISQPSAARQAWVLCSDEFTLGCAQHEFSSVLNIDGEDFDVPIKDKKGNSQICRIKNCIDRTTPKLIVYLKNGSTITDTFTVNPQSTNQTDITSATHNTWLNKDNYPDGVTVEVVVVDATSKLKSFSWYQNAAGQKVPGETNIKVSSTSNISDSSYNSSGQFVKRQTITDDGVRKQVISVEDKAGNKIIYNLTIKVDRTPPSCSIVGDGVWNPAGANIHTTCSDANGISNMKTCPNTVSHTTTIDAKETISDDAENSSTCSYTVETTTQYRKANCAAYNRNYDLCGGCDTYKLCRRIAHDDTWKTYMDKPSEMFSTKSDANTEIYNALSAWATEFNDMTYTTGFSTKYKRGKNIIDNDVITKQSDDKSCSTIKWDEDYHAVGNRAIYFTNMNRATCYATETHMANFVTSGRWNDSTKTCYVGVSNYYWDCGEYSQKKVIKLKTYKLLRTSSCGCELAKACKEAGCATWSAWQDWGLTAITCDGKTCTTDTRTVYK